MVCLVAAALLAPASPISILVFTKTAGFRHDSIPVAKRCVYTICQREGWKVAFTEDPSWFKPNVLRQFDGVIFLLTTGDVLDDAQQAAFERYVRSGKGYVGVHAASDTEYDWPWYGKLVGAYFKGHPAIQEAIVKIEDAGGPGTRHAPNPWKRTDEWYNFRTNPRGQVRVLASVDESSYKGGDMGADHPVVWCHEYDGGRSWYTAMGHTKESYSEPAFVQMFSEGISWACQRKK